MLNEERRRLIVEMVKHDGRVLVGPLAKHFHTSRLRFAKTSTSCRRRGRFTAATAAHCRPIPAFSKIPRCAKKKSSIAKRRCKSRAPRPAW